MSYETRSQETWHTSFLLEVMDVELASDHLSIHAQIASGEDQGLRPSGLVSDQHLQSSAVNQ